MKVKLNMKNIPHNIICMHESKELSIKYARNNSPCLGFFFHKTLNSKAVNHYKKDSDEHIWNKALHALERISPTKEPKA